MKQPQTFAELMEHILTLFPDAEVGEDLEGQIVIYTGLQEHYDDWGQYHLLPFQEQDEQPSGE